jgi:hypothetical protein
MRGSTSAHTALCRAILAELGAMPGVVLGSNPSGRSFLVDERTGEKRVVQYGWPSAAGGPDLLAVVAPRGRMVALECKTGAAVATKEQRACHAALRAVGVEVHVVRSVNEAREALEEHAA